MSAETVHNPTEQVVSHHPPSSSHPSSSRPSSYRRPYSVDTRDQGLEIKHGVLPDYSLRVRGRLHTVIFHPDSQTCVLHHTSGCGVYCRTSLQREFEASDMSNVQRLLHAPQHNVYVGICKHHIKVWQIGTKKSDSLPSFTGSMAGLYLDQPMFQDYCQ